jgi:C_GCAxxG_C_C family probable redox protein
MSQTFSRRRFVRAAAGSAGTLALVSCGKQAASPSATTARPTPAPPSAAAAPPPSPLADTLPKASFLDFLDAIADTNMRRCHHCAQASFLSLQEGFGLPGGAIVKALTPIPGIAERGETCGAVIGSLLAIGLVFGRERDDDWAGWRACLTPAREFCARFEKELGSTQCGSLLEKHFGKRYNLADPKDLAEFQAARPGPTEVCGRVVRTAVRLAAEVILDQRAAAGKAG